ncbi:unnamed protein product [Somion occarium]|uniref:MYND-type domain-containing protein n=1 Tax=Somion occarium TaxID=3059160 RepID=A0ABP1E8V9_9APHY
MASSNETVEHGSELPYTDMPSKYLYFESNTYQRDSKIFKDMLRDAPGEVANTLRELHSKNDIARMALAKEIRDVLLAGPTRMQMSSFLSTGVLGLLADLVSDKTSYVFGVDPKAAHMEAFYPISIFSSMFKMAKYLHTYFDECHGKYRDIIEDYLGKLPRFWNLLWDTLIPSGMLEGCFPDQKDKVDGGYDLQLRMTLVTVCHHSALLYEKFVHRLPPFTERLAHVMLYCWRVSLGRQTRACCMQIVYMSMQYCLVLKDAATPELFLCEAAPSDDIVQDVLDGLVAVFIDHKIERDFVTHSLVLFFMVMEHRPRNFRKPLESMVAKCISGLTTLCQRVLCLDDEETSDTVIKMTLASMNEMLNFVEPSGGLAIQMIKSADFLQIVTYILPSCVNRGDEDLFHAIAQMLKTYGNVGEYQHRFTTSTHLRDIVLKDYVKTTHVLKSLDRRLRTALSKKACNAWDIFGSEMNMENHLKLYTESQIRPGLFPPSWKACHWDECLCHNMHPRHPMKICKGCWNARYCCTKCQRLDWTKGGHKEECRRYNCI